MWDLGVYFPHHQLLQSGVWSHLGCTLELSWTVKACGHLIPTARDPDELCNQGQVFKLSGWNMLRCTQGSSPDILLLCGSGLSFLVPQYLGRSKWPVSCNSPTPLLFPTLPEVYFPPVSYPRAMSRGSSWRSLSLEGPDGVRGTGHTASWAGQAAQCLKAPRPVHNRVPSIHMFMPEEATRATSHQLCSRDPRPCLCCGVPTNEMS